jgi:hypothetical protein
MRLIGNQETPWESFKRAYHECMATERPLFREALGKDLDNKNLDPSLAVALGRLHQDHTLSPEQLIVGSLQVLEQHRSGPVRIPALVNAMYDHKEELDASTLRRLGQQHLPDGASLTMIKEATSGTDIGVFSRLGQLVSDQIQDVKRAFNAPTSGSAEAEARLQELLRFSLPRLKERGMPVEQLSILQRYAQGERLGNDGPEGDLVQVLSQFQKAGMTANAAPEFVNALYDHRDSFDLGKLRSLAKAGLQEGPEATMMDTYTEVGLNKQGLTGSIRRLGVDLADRIAQRRQAHAEAPSIEPSSPQHNRPGM